MPRFYSPQLFTPGASAQLAGAVAHHLHVVRTQPGAKLTLFNGDGGQYAVTLIELCKRHATVHIDAFEPVDVEAPYAVMLAQALPEGSKMDWIVEKAVELGAASIQPLAAQRSVVRLSSERAEKRQAHWQGVIVSASEQCGRNRLVQLHALSEFKAWLAAPSAVPRILLTPRATGSLAGWARANEAQPVTIMIGPEGGFTPDEEDAALAAGAIALSMGPRVLRTETAGLAALALLAGAWGGI